MIGEDISVAVEEVRGTMILFTSHTIHRSHTALSMTHDDIIFHGDSRS